MTSRTTAVMNADVSKRMNVSILSEVMLAVVQRSERNEHTVSDIAIHTRGRRRCCFFSSWRRCNIYPTIMCRPRPVHINSNKYATICKKWYDNMPYCQFQLKIIAMWFKSSSGGWGLGEGSESDKVNQNLERLFGAVVRNFIFFCSQKFKFNECIFLIKSYGCGLCYPYSV